MVVAERAHADNFLLLAGLEGTLQIFGHLICLHFELSLLLLELDLLLRFRLFLRIELRRRFPAYLLHIIIHRRVGHKISHENSFVWVTHRKLHLLFAQLSVGKLKAWVLVLVHDKCVRPQLNKIEEQLLDGVPAPLRLLCVRHMFEECFAALSFEQLEKDLEKFVG